MYKFFAYDDYKPNQNKLISLEEINSHFGIEFEGIQEGEVVNAKFKSAEIIKKELSKMNFEQ